MTRTYSLGFLFTYDYSKVALIRKIKPDWQKGKLNGVGGKVEEGESFRRAMQREWEEEAGIPVSEDGWKLIIEQHGRDYILGVFSQRLHVMEPKPFITAEEQVAWYLTHSIATRDDVIPNLKWMIPLCLDQEIRFPIQVNA